MLATGAEHQSLLCLSLSSPICEHLLFFSLLSLRTAMKITTDCVHEQIYYSIEKALECFVRLFLYEGVA